LEAILQPLGYDILTILDPLQGVSLLLKHKPQLIFLDLVMPSTNGYELCTFLRRSSVFKETPIVMLTGHDGMVDRLRAKVVGSTDFLSKPPDTTKVLQVVQKHLGGLPNGIDSTV
jgi:chemotaxis family two-component system response regulator PixG